MLTIRKPFKRRSRTFLTVYYWAKFLGINPLSLSPKNRLEFSYFSLLYACFLSVIYCYGFYHILNERLNLLLPDETPSSVIADCSEIINVGLEILLTWLMNSFFQNRLKHIVESFSKAEKISRKLDIAENYENHFKRLRSNLIIVNASWISLVIWNDIELSRFSNFRPIIWTCYNLLRLPPFNSVTAVLWSLGVVRRKFHRLNEKIRFLMLQDYAKSYVLETNVCSGSIKKSSYNPGVLSDTIDMISQQHRELIRVVHTIKRHFDLLLLLCIMAHISNGLVNTYLAYRSVKDNNLMTASDWISTSSYISWFCFPICTLLVISNVCGSTINEANQTANILHGMLNNYENFSDSREVAKISMFSFDLLQNPLKISLFGLFDLNHWLVYKVIVMATTYIIIMFQFYN